MSHAQFGAPITRYDDPRLEGSLLYRPVRDIYAHWFRPLANPVAQQEFAYFVEMGRRSCNALAGIIACSILGFFALCGHIAQIIHFHQLTKEERKKPAARTHQGMQLPTLFAATQFHTVESLIQTDQTISDLTFEQLEMLLRGGNTPESEMPGKGPYYIKTKTLELSVYEIAIPQNAEEGKETLYDTWSEKGGTIPHGPLFEKALNELFTRNGFRAFKAGRHTFYLDPLVTTITEIGEISS